MRRIVLAAAVAAALTLAVCGGTPSDPVAATSIDELRAISLVIFVFIIGAGVRGGMRWARMDERKERTARGQACGRQTA